MRRLLFALLALPALAGATERLVTIGGDVTEIVWALGSGREVVARDSTSTHPAATKALPDIGYMRQLNAEGILAMRPTLVLASDQAQPSLALKQIADAGIKVVTIPGQKRLGVIETKIDAIARALDKVPQGNTLRHQIRAQLASVPSRPLPVRVLFIMSHAGTTAMAAGQETAADTVIRAAGLTNTMQGFTRYQPLSQEGVIASEPDLVVVTENSVQTLGGKDKVWDLPGLAQTPAARHRRLLVVDDMALLGLGPETPRQIANLRATAEHLP